MAVPKEEETTWIHSIYYVGGPRSNYLAKLAKAGGKWCLFYRFRYYVDRKAHDSEDVKRFYTCSMPDDSDASLQKALDSVHRLLPMIARQIGGEPDIIHLDCAHTDPKVFFELGSRPWAHVKIVSPG